MSKKNPEGLAKNWQLIQQDLKRVKQAIKDTKADNPGWTHQYMQDQRTLVRNSVVLPATIIGIVLPLVFAVAVAGWVGVYWLL